MSQESIISRYGTKKPAAKLTMSFRRQFDSSSFFVQESHFIASLNAPINQIMPSRKTTADKSVSNHNNGDIGQNNHTQVEEIGETKIAMSR